MAKVLGSLVTLQPREVWINEALDFTPWLATNIALLGAALGMELELVEIEAGVGDFRVDVVARDTVTSRLIVVENQLERTDHSHMGQLLTYAAGQDATCVVWIAPKFREPHRKAIDWLNDHTTPGLDFFAVEIELLKVDDSLPAPHFKVVAQPNEWAKVARTAATSGTTDLGARYQAFFAEVLQRFKELRPNATSANRTIPDNWLMFAGGKSGLNFSWSLPAGSKMRVELYIDTGDQQRNKGHFDQLLAMRSSIETALGIPIEWERMENKKASRLSVARLYEGKFDEDPALVGWAAETMAKFTDVLRPIIKAL